MLATAIGLAGNESAKSEPREEIVVTVRKKEEPLLSVPVAVTALSSEFIDALGLENLDDIARYTPGFSFNSATGRQAASNRPAIRGITTIRNGIANTSAAATFIDGVYVGGSAQSTEFYNLERIEILRGPQSAQYGRATYAGAINYVTRRPPDQLSGNVAVSVAEHETLYATGWVGGPLLGESLQFALSAGHREYGGEYANSIDGRTVGAEEADDVTAKLFWQPGDDLEIGLKLGLQSTDDNHFPVYLQSRNLNSCCFRTAESPRAREYFVGEVASPAPVALATDLLDAAGGAGTRLDRRLATFRINWSAPWGLEVSSISGYIDDTIERGFDASYAAYDPLPFLPGFFTQRDEIEQRDLSQELRVSSPGDAPVRLTGGLYYYDGESNEVTDDRVTVDANGALNVLPNFGSLTRDEIQNIAVFGSAEWDFAARWTAGVELRWARDKIAVANFANDGTGLLLERFRDDFHSVTPRFTLRYLSDSGATWYANVAKGTKPGDFNADVPDTPSGTPDERFRAVDEEAIWNYELGVKGRWWQDRVYAGVAGYYLDVTDQQLTQLVELGNGATASIIQNVGKTEVYGLEIEAAVALTDRLSANASYAWTDAEIRERISTDEADLRGGDGSVEQTRLLGDVSGRKVPRMPEHMASLLLRYERSLSRDVVWSISGDYTFESSKFAQEHNLIETGERSLVGLRTGIDSGRLEAVVWVTNLFDDDTPVDIQRYFDRRSGTLQRFPQAGASPPSSSPRAFAVTLPRGRQFGATLRWRF